MRKITNNIRNTAITYILNSPPKNIRKKETMRIIAYIIPQIFFGYVSGLINFQIVKINKIPPPRNIAKAKKGMKFIVTKYKLLFRNSPLMFRNFTYSIQRRKAHTVIVGFSIVATCQMGVFVRTPPSFEGESSGIFYSNQRR